jgi:hypothetical protein
MGFAVALLTWGYSLMLLLMTISTRKIVVLGLICFKQGEGFVMACSAVVRRYLVRVSDNERHMNRVASLTGLKIHILGVFFVALHAIRYLSVSCMALVTGQIGVSTGLSLYLLTLLGVAR